MEEFGVQDFKSLKVDDVRQFIIDAVPKNKNSLDLLIWATKKFVMFLTSFGYAVIDSAKLVIFSVPKRRKVLPCFSKEEIDAILSAVDTSTHLGIRDYAIPKLAIGTGLRGADIAGLKLSDIDWRKSEISVIQSKTSKTLTLPLLPDVGNSIANYILKARPQSDSPHIFLRHVKPHVWLSNSAVGPEIIKRYLKNAGISRMPGDGKTFHGFRRKMGTSLVKAEIPIATVAQILGHQDFRSTTPYVALNDDLLRVCCMDISAYSTRKEGLA